MSRFTLLLGGDLIVTPRVAAQVAGTRVIAADSGIRHAGKLALVPELWVGDFDSSADEIQAAYPQVARRTFPAEKDQTDGELAASIALREGATSLVMAGAFGGLRADHAFLHLTLALRLAQKGVDVILTSGAQEGLPLPHGLSTFDFSGGTLFSILGFSELSGLTLSGARWPLDDVEVPLGSSLTISNAVSGQLKISLRAGRAMLLTHPYPIEGS